jgi:hypothetical protein
VKKRKLMREDTRMRQEFPMTLNLRIGLGQDYAPSWLPLLTIHIRSIKRVRHHSLEKANERPTITSRRVTFIAHSLDSTITTLQYRNSRFNRPYPPSMTPQVNLRDNSDSSSGRHSLLFLWHGQGVAAIYPLSRYPETKCPIHTALLHIQL